MTVGMWMPRAALVLAVLLLLMPPTWAADAVVKEELGVRVAMRDGVNLVADVFRPEAAGSYPVLLQRTPYNRTGAREEARKMAAKGYIVVIQDTRGRYESGGTFYPFRHETADGYDTVEWAAALPQSNGDVGMFGGSYVGATQMLAAIGKPPHLKAIFPYVTAAEYYEGWTYQSGVLMEWFASSWTSGLAEDTLNRELRARRQPHNWVFTTPVENYPILDIPKAKDLAPYFRDWVKHETNDAYWKPWKIADHYGEMDVMGLHGVGWHDIFQKGSILNYMGLHDQGKTPRVRNGQRLMIGPWAHAATSDEGKIGDVVFGTDAVLDMTATSIDWFDYALKGKQNRFASEAPVQIFVMGENVWRGEQEFPLKRAKETRYYLHAEGGANGVAGGGELRTEKPGALKPDVFVYDPANPVPTIGGRLCCGGDPMAPGPFDQSPNESRADVLVYSTPPLSQDVEVTGFIKAELYAATTARDTDFTVMLVDVAPDGYARFLADGIVRAKFRNSDEKAEPITPGKVYKYDINLWATSNVFKAGHRIRVYVSSSNFPRFHRNGNTGGNTYGGVGMVKATQTIYHDAERPSAIVLPIIPR